MKHKRSDVIIVGGGHAGLEAALIARHLGKTVLMVTMDVRAVGRMSCNPAIELRSKPFIWWITDLSAPDKILELPFTIPIYGSYVAALPILMVVSMFIQQKMMAGSTQQPQQKIMQYTMSFFFFFIFNSFPSGLNLYYTLFNILTIAQQKLVKQEPKKEQ